jgi:hypothetical protein
MRRISGIAGKLLAFIKYLLHGFGWLVSERRVLKKEQEVTHSCGNEVPGSSQIYLKVLVNLEISTKLERKHPAPGKRHNDGRCPLQRAGRRDREWQGES